LAWDCKYSGAFIRCLVQRADEQEALRFPFWCALHLFGSLRTLAASANAFMYDSFIKPNRILLLMKYKAEREREKRERERESLVADSVHVKRAQAAPTNHYMRN